MKDRPASVTDSPMPIRPRVLLVDDEPSILQGLSLQLSRLYDVVSAESGERALERLESDGPFAVIVSDMRMPGMNGSALLRHVHQRHPETVRMLLTGYTDIASAISAINEGHVFRFLTKPCAPEHLRKALSDAVEQHRLFRAERDLLERTLRGAVHALVEVLALVEPAAYGRALRVQRLCLELSRHTDLRPRWPLELAALLCPLGEVGISSELLQARNTGRPLTAAEQAVFNRAPEITDKLLASIPRLEPVREILQEAVRSTGGAADPVGSPALVLVLQSARILRLVQDFDLLESRGFSAAQALAEMQTRPGAYAPVLMKALSAHVSDQSQSVYEIRELPVSLLRPGMVLAEELRTHSGQLLAPRGYPISASFQARACNFDPGHVREPVRVMLSAATA